MYYWVLLMHDEKKKISLWVPCNLLDAVLSAGYASQTDAVIAGLSLLVDKTKRIQNNTKEDEIEKAEMRVRLEETQAHNETLKKELEKAGQDKEAIQNLYNNYMLQMQTLINQKAIEAPGSKKPWWRFW